MSKIRILYMDMLWGFGGIESYILNVVDQLDRDVFSFDIALPGNWKHINEDALTDRGVNVIHYEVNTLQQQVDMIRGILRKGNYDIIHVMQNYASLELPAVFSLVAIWERRKHHYKIINHAHSVEDLSKTTPFVKRTVREAFRMFLRACFSKADLLAACSPEAGDFLYGKKRQVEVFYNGIDLNRFVSAGSCGSIPQWREKYGIDPDRMNFITVSRMSEEKNPLFLLDVIGELRRYYPELRVSWIGDGGMRKEVEARIRTLGLTEHVHLLGAQHHVEEILACCDYFLLPSKREGLGIVFIEAQAAGIPCFTSDRVPKIADCGGVTFIGLEKTAGQWAEEIHRKIEAEQELHIDDDQLNRYDINRTVAQLREVYLRLAEK